MKLMIKLDVLRAYDGLQVTHEWLLKFTVHRLQLTQTLPQNIRDHLRFYRSNMIEHTSGMLFCGILHLLHVSVFLFYAAVVVMHTTWAFGLLEK